MLKINQNSWSKQQKGTLIKIASYNNDILIRHKTLNKTVTCYSKSYKLAVPKTFFIAYKAKTNRETRLGSLKVFKNHILNAGC